MSTPGVEPGLSRPRRDVLTTRRCGLHMRCNLCSSKALIFPRGHRFSARKHIISVWLRPTLRNNSFFKLIYSRCAILRRNATPIMRNCNFQIKRIAFPLLWIKPGPFASQAEMYTNTCVLLRKMLMMGDISCVV